MSRAPSSDCVEGLPRIRYLFRLELAAGRLACAAGDDTNWPLKY